LHGAQCDSQPRGVTLKPLLLKPPIQTMLNSVSWKSNNNAYERKQDFKIVSSVRNTATHALTATFRGLAMSPKTNGQFT